MEKDIIYHVLTSYQFFECIIFHKLNFSDRYCWFIIPKGFKGMVPQIDTFVEEKYISGYYEVDPLYGFKDTIRPGIAVITQYFDDLLLKIPSNQSVAYFVAGAYRNFGYYLSLKGIEFSIFEDAPGTVSGINQRNYDKNSLPHVFNAIESQKLYDGKCKYVKNILCTAGQKDTVAFEIREKIVEFNVIKAFKTLDLTEQERLLNIYNAKIPYVNQNFSIVLTQWFVFNNKLSKDPRIALHYQYLCDVLLRNESIILKPHPNDPIDYAKYFHDIFIIKSKYPSELILCQTNSINSVVSINSTANNMFEGYAKSNIRLGIDPFYPLEIYNKLLVVFDFLKKYSDYAIRFYGIIDGFFQILTEKYFNKKSFWVMPKDIRGKTVLVIDYLSWGQGTSIGQLSDILKTADDESIFVFLNRDNDSAFLNIEFNTVFNNFVPIVIQKKFIDNTIYSNGNEEIFWVYSKNKEIREFAKVYNFELYLKRVGILLSVTALEKKNYESVMLNQKINALLSFLNNNWEGGKRKS